MWPFEDIKGGHGIYKDNLLGMTEARFRSARLHTWYDTPNDYYQQSLKELRAKAVDYDDETNFNKI